MGMSDSSITSRFDKSYNRATVLRSSGDYRKALKNFFAAIELAVDLPDRKDDRIYHSYLGAARCLFNLGEHNEAEENYHQAFALIDSLVEEKPSLKASVLWELAVLYTEQKRFEEAAIFFERSIYSARASSDTEERFIADCFWGLSKCYCALRNLEAAEVAIRKAIKIYEHCSDDVEAAIATNRRNLANILIERNQYKEAFVLLEKYGDQLIRLSDKDKQDYPGAFFKLAWCAQKNGDYLFADRILKKALRLIRLANGAKSPLTALAKLTLAHNKTCQADYLGAEKLLKDAVKMLAEADMSVYKYDYAGALFELGQCLMKQKRFKAAIEVLNKLLAIHEDDPLFSPELFADTLHSLALCHEMDCSYAAARDYNLRCLFIKEQIYGRMHEEVAQSLFQLSSCLRKLDNGREAEFAQTRANEITEALFTSS